MDNKVIDQPKVHAMNITSIEAELMSICIGLVSALDNIEPSCVTIITDSLTAVEKIFNLNIDLYQCSIIPIASKIEFFLKRDLCNSIHFWYSPSKAKWSKQAFVNEEVKATHQLPTLPSKNSFLFSKKKDKEQVLKPTYAKGGIWLPIIGGTSNSICARFTCMMIKHAPICKYHQQFFLLTHLTIALVMKPT